MAGRCIALHVRAWIEILTLCLARAPCTVALHVRAWIEIHDDAASKTMGTESPST